MSAGSKVPGMPGVISDAAKQSFQQQKFFFNRQAPITRQLQKQTLEALRTGGVGAQIPIIQRGVEQTKLGTSQALRSLGESLSSSNLINTPFGQKLRAQVSQQGAMQTATLPSTVASSFISGAPGFSQNLAQMGASLGATSLGQFGTIQSARTAAQGQIKGSMMDMLGQLGVGLGTAAAGMCDERLKQNCHRIGTSPSGLGIYEFSYIANPQTRFRGPIAQDVQALRPDAVVADMDGFLYVRLDRIDVPLERIS